ncbi:TolC family protein [Mastigocoleus testarum]|uniref:Transporter n=1 Tax=Mastigocoleus testarum BC008 TaxID=371196 RepID=A0A0V7ZH01_9CYAN|nr:TolC family protein [Mastigocoleus testarum]KST63833.1 hypothetical protein BC008_15365 [Mastigocoleus testarum BC008]
MILDNFYLLQNKKIRRDVKPYISDFFITTTFLTLNSIIILTVTMGSAFADVHENKIKYLSEYISENISENLVEDKYSQPLCINLVCDQSEKNVWVADALVPDVFNKYPAIFQRTLSEQEQFDNNLNASQDKPKKEGKKPNDSSQNLNKPQLTRTQINTSNPERKKLNTEKNNLRKQQQEKEIRLSLSDVVFLVVANNTDIKNAYLNRIAEKEDLAVEEDKFVPNLTPTFSLSLDGLGGNTNSNSTGRAGAQVEVRVPTGATLNFNWEGNAEISGENNLSSGTNDDFFRQSFQVDINQPILRGAGTKVNRASVKIARLQEQENIINLKSTLINTITNSIIAYRNLLQAQERVKIQQLTLKNAQESLEVTQALIDAGRRAPVDIIQNEANVARIRVNLLNAENQLESRKVALLTILDIDKNTKIVAEGIPPVKPTVLNLNKLRETALANRPSYLISKIDVSQNKLQLLEAKDRRRWNLSLTASLRNETDQESDARAGLSLSRTIGDLSLKQQFERARVNLLQSENSLQNNLADLDLGLQDRIREVNLSFSQLELAQNSTRLSQQQLEIEEERRRLGRDVTILDLIRLQEDLAQARVDELDATIGYLNALTNLDLFLGTTLQTWNIEIRD